MTRRVLPMFPGVALLVATLFGAMAVAATPANSSPSDDPGAATLAATPPMGFNDWLNFGCNVSESLMVSVADEFVSLGLKDAGYQYVNIDDCWAAHLRAADGSLQADPAKFPHGMKWLADYVHAKGLKFGIYSAASPTTCAGYPASDSHYDQDMRTFASWGVDYIKLDLCGSAANTEIQQHCNDTAASRDFEQRYAQARAAVDASGRPMILAVSAPASIAYWCGYDNASYRDAMSWAPRYGQLWRTSVDAGQSWASVLSTYSQNVTLADYHSVGHWNDADMLVAGSSHVSLTEQQTQFTLWAEMAAPLLISTDLAHISPGASSILTNREVIAVDQDPLGAQGTLVASGPRYDVLTKPLANGDRAVVLLNKGDTAQTITTSAAAVGFDDPGTYFVTDLVGKQRTMTRGTIAANLPPHGSVIYRISNHATGGAYGPATALTISHPTLTPGATTPVDVTIADNGPQPVTDIDLALRAPTGWTVTPNAQQVSLIRGGTAQTLTFDVTPPSQQQPGTTVADLTATAAYDYPAGTRTTITGQDTITFVVPYPNLAAGFNNIGITDDTNPTPGNMDGSRDSYSAQALAQAGVTPGSTFTYDGVAFTWPDVPAGTPDNVAGGAPTITLAGSGTKLGFLGAGIGQPSGTGIVTYTDGTTQSYTLSFPNWADATPSTAVINARYRNTPSGPANFGYYYRVFYAAVPLESGKQIANVTLPATNAIHVFAMATG